MAAATLDLSALLQNVPEGAWVAISERENKVLAYAAELQAVLDQALELGEREPLVVRVPEQASALFP
jgi:hypothetical protein